MNKPLKTHYFVYWSRPGWKRAFEADIFADTPREARERFMELFPEDLVLGVKLAGRNYRPANRGRWVA